MNSEDLMRAIGQLDEKSIDQSMNYQPVKKKHYFRWVMAAICIAVAFRFIQFGGGMNDIPAGSLEGNLVWYYGPTLPLTALNKEAKELDIIRSVDYNLTNASKADINDQYLIQNNTDHEIVLEGAYPYISGLCSSKEYHPTIIQDGTIIESSIYAGEEFDSTNEGYSSLEQILNTNTANQTVVKYPALLQNVTVYKVNGFDTHTNNPGAIKITFDYNLEKTKILAFATSKSFIEEGVMDEDNLYDYVIQDMSAKANYFIVLGEPIYSYTYQGYTNGSCLEQDKVEDATLDIETYTCSLGEILNQIIEDTITMNNYDSLQTLSPDTLQIAFTHILVDHNYLEITHHQENDYSLWNVISRLLQDSRILYSTFNIVIPADSEVQLDIQYIKEGSVTTGNDQMYQYELATKLGTNLTFNKQYASIELDDSIKLVENDFGFESNNKAELDQNKDYYTFLVQQK